MNDISFWRKCSSCKNPIGFNQNYWVCSVSTCNRQRTGLVFCKVSCFDAHVPMMNHKDAGAFEKRSPTELEWKKMMASTPPETSGKTSVSPVSHEILVVVSKTKDYIRAVSGLNASAEVMDLLSNRIRSMLDEASQRAVQAGRKTLLERDFL